MKPRLIRLLVLAGASLTALAGSTSSAMATNCTHILGAGSSLQNLAQKNVWIPGFTNTGGWWENLCPNKPEVLYDSTSSGKGKAKWGYESGTLDELATGENIPAFVGTDLAPNKAQIENMGAAGEQPTHAKATMSVPVAQSAVTVDVSLPVGCHPASGHPKAEITAKHLREEWETGTKLVSEYVKNVEGSCSVAPTVYVRSSNSGTTAGFKRYFDTFENVAPWKAITETPLESEEVKWPMALELSGNFSACCEKGSQLAHLVLLDPGTTGYADLSDARNEGFGANAEWVEHTNGSSQTYLSAIAEVETTEPKEFNSPEEGSGGSNCIKAKYKGEGTLEVEPGADWSEAKQTNVKEAGYPICTLTFDLAWNKYSTMKLELATHGYGTEAKEIGLTVLHYLHKVVLSTFGQSEALTLQHFGELPTGIRGKAETGTSEPNILP